MNVEHLLVTRKVTLEASGGADNILISLNAGTPYRHYLAWVAASGATINVVVQPLFGKANDGASTNIVSLTPAKVIQVPIEEIRPPTRGVHKHPDDIAPPVVMASELDITNNAATPVDVTVYMIAAATIGGA